MRVAFDGECWLQASKSSKSRHIDILAGMADDTNIQSRTHIEAFELIAMDFIGDWLQSNDSNKLTNPQQSQIFHA